MYLEGDRRAYACGLGISADLIGDSPSYPGPSSISTPVRLISPLSLDPSLHEAMSVSSPREFRIDLPEFLFLPMLRLAVTGR